MAIQDRGEHRSVPRPLETQVSLNLIATGCGAFVTGSKMLTAKKSSFDTQYVWGA
jgi:hypothetical protein